ncbi:hypothetical protein MVEN_01364200 [Mycena venus]|uniref:Uncharacterized protein n=1 Tax=Mycena venus TaxID=2733690 RepID=A0A8H6XYD1_9AGAR|nr:hypothetical protein MVEN_01364200 [Mycena venus]
MSSSAAPLSDTDAAFLYRYGNDVAEDSADVITETGLVALYSVIFAFAMYSFYRKGIKTRAASIMLCVVISLYAAAIVLWALNLVDFYMSVHVLLMDNANTPLPDRGALSNEKRAGLPGPRNTLLVFNIIVADSVLLWRVWVIYFRKRWVFVFPCVMWFTTFVFLVIATICQSRSNLAVCNINSGLTGWCFSLGTNVLCTLLVGFQAWKHRRITRFLHLRKSKTDQILSLLVESGCIYCLLWVPQVVIAVLNTPRTKHAQFYATMVLDAFGDQLSGIYVTLIVVIVNLRYTIQWEEADSVVSIPITRRGERGNISTICFATPPSTTQQRDAHVVAFQLDDSGVLMDTMNGSREEWKETLEPV